MWSPGERYSELGEPSWRQRGPEEVIGRSSRAWAGPVPREWARGQVHEACLRKWLSPLEPGWPRATSSWLYLLSAGVTGVCHSDLPSLFPSLPSFPSLFPPLLFLFSLYPCVSIFATFILSLFMELEPRGWISPVRYLSWNRTLGHTCAIRVFFLLLRVHVCHDLCVCKSEDNL